MFLASAVQSFSSDFFFFMMLYIYFYYYFPNKWQMSPGLILEIDLLSSSPAGSGNGVRRRYRMLSSIVVWKFSRALF